MLLISTGIVTTVIYCQIDSEKSDRGSTKVSVVHKTNMNKLYLDGRRHLTRNSILKVRKVMIATFSCKDKNLNRFKVNRFTMRDSMNVRSPYQFTSRARIWTQSKVTTHKHAQISKLIARAPISSLKQIF